MSKSILLACLYTMSMPGACRDKKRMLDHLELELGVVVSHLSMLGNRLMLSAEQLMLIAEPSLQPPSNTTRSNLVFMVSITA